MADRRSIDIGALRMADKRKSWGATSAMSSRKSIDSTASLTDDVVTPETIQDHLIYMRFQYSLLASLNSSQLHRFLVHAEARYVRYLCLVESFKDSEIPLPPWDVCIIFHAHIMDPHFFPDIAKSHPSLLRRGSTFKFPLSRLSQLIRSKIWTDVWSRKAWEEYIHTCSSSYQVIESMDDEPFFEDVEFECTRCCEVEVFPFAALYKMRSESVGEGGNNKSIGVCHGCGMVLMKERLQLGALARDVEQWLASESAYKVRGLTKSPHMSDDLLILLKGTQYPSLSFSRTESHLTPLGEYLLSSRRLSTDDLTQAAKSTVRQIKRASCPSHLAFPDLFTRHILPLYANSIYSTITSDLVEAILEQSFTPGPWISSMLDLDFPHAVDRYSKFIALKEGNRRYYVPTVDIDLCIRTARLSCKRRFLDTKQGKGMEALRETCVMWVRRYHEGYTTIDVRKGYWTTNRVVRGVLCPITGFRMLCDYRDLGKARIKMMKGSRKSSGDIRDEVILLGVGDNIPKERDVLEVDIGSDKSKEDLG